MQIAIVGAGVSGLVCGWMLHRDHDLTLFEANDDVGGHTHTAPVEPAGRRFEGRVHHTRMTPARHAFAYRVFMVYLDPAELDVASNRSSGMRTSIHSPGRLCAGARYEKATVRSAV